MEKLKVGIIGCGNISEIYLKNLKNKFQSIELKACSDLDMNKAKAKAEEFKISAMTVEEILSDDEIKIIVNLTIPKAHMEVCEKVIKSGKSVYVEKPLSITRDDGKYLLDLAKKHNVLIGGAPDTFMGAGIQTCRKLIDDGFIGTPISFNGFMMCHGHESWHPDPEFYYEIGGGPMFDMGPYYLTALINLLGPVESVFASTKISFPKRTITSEKKYGKEITVEVPTHVTGIMNFKDNVTGTLTTSFDVWHHTMPHIEIYGSHGSIIVPDPNTFGGKVKIKRHTDSEWNEISLTHINSENSRGIGVADMAYAILNNRKPRASGELTYHVLDIMQSFHEAADNNNLTLVESSCDKPKALNINTLDEIND